MNRYGDKPYYSLNWYFKEKYNKKVYKVAVNGGFSCPNRDGTLSTKGCIFCDNEGSGHFTGGQNNWQDANQGTNDPYDIYTQIEQGIDRLSRKIKDGLYIAYFQSFTNTYDTVSELKRRFDTALKHPMVIGLSIGTRPDCLSPEILDLLESYSQKWDIYVELGLQTIHSETALLINRCYPLSTYDEAVSALYKRGIKTVTHMIIGLPGEDPDMIKETASYIADSGVHGIKFHLLHVLKNTALEELYHKKKFDVLTRTTYTDLLIDCIELLPKNIVIHRITGDGPKELMVAPLWSLDKRGTLNYIHHRFKERGSYQGSIAPDNPTSK